MSDGYQILDLATVEPFPYHQRDGQKLLPIAAADRLSRRPASTAGSATAGDTLVPKHAEDSDNEELYVVVRGHATLHGRRDDDRRARRERSAPAARRGARGGVAEAPGTIIVAIGATVGKAYEPQGWTSFVVADHYRREGRSTRAARRSAR